MHRQMLASVNAQLVAISQPQLVPWQNIPAPDDTEYPVPGRNSTTDKTDNFYYDDLLVRVEDLLNPVKLRGRSLAHTGALLESAIHDPLHRRWAAVSVGQMNNFPVLDPTIINPTISSVFDSSDVDWLGHPYSSHVNSDFWMLHGWCDQVIEQWRIANNLPDITWTDTWIGGLLHHEGLDFSSMDGMTEDPSHKHDHLKHDPHSERELMKVFKTLNSFNDCQIGFDYIVKNNIPLPELN
jgi:hypothetical protein